jgi:acyl-CoA synthetase (AMP-forming)/AMP-acid ligase II
MKGHAAMIYASPHPPIDAQFAALPELVHRAADCMPEQPALIDAATGAAVSYAALASRIDRVAAGLAERGFLPGDVLALQAPNMPPWAGVALGAMAAGGTVTGISPLATEREIATQLADAGASVLATIPSLAADSQAAAAAVGAREVIVIGDTKEPASAGEVPAATPIGELLACRAAAPEGTPGPAKFAVLPYSSGTTGLPKGVMLTHANLTAAASQLGYGLALTPGDRFLALAPFAHVMGFVVSLCAPLAAGATVVTLPRYELDAFLAAIERHRVTVAAVPPPVFAALARDPAVGSYDLSSLQMVVSGGAPLGPQVQQAVADRLPGTAVGQGYGLTETTATVTVPARTGTLPGSVGRLASGTQLRLMNPGTGHDAAHGEPGELWVRGPQVMAGYLGRPAATAEILDTGGWLRTGDLAASTPTGTCSLPDASKNSSRSTPIRWPPPRSKHCSPHTRR